jgi:ribosomal protein S18 acetylase RimI-like enzyme
MYIYPMTGVTDEIVVAFTRLVPQLTHRQPPTRGDLETLISNWPGTVLLLAREPDENGPIVGSAALVLFRTATGTHTRLEDLVVDESLRGKGIGEALTRECIRLAHEAGADYVALTSHPRREAANRLYQRMGFQKHETNVYIYKFE